MLALLLNEKANVQREVDTARDATNTLETTRSGLYVTHEKFSVQKLATLLQDIARAKFAELRLITFLFGIEEKLQAENGVMSGVVSLGSAAAFKHERKSRPQAPLMVPAYA